jgi:hypothetical protein
MSYNIPNQSYPNILRLGGAAGTAHHQTDKGLLWIPPSYAQRFGQDQAFVSQRKGIEVTDFTLHNRSGAACNVGIGFRLHNSVWRGGRYDGTTFTDLTSTMQAQSAATLQVGGAGADNTGFVILSRVKFDWVSVNITTAETDAGGAQVPDHAVTYSLASAAWGTMATTTAFVDDFTLTNTVYTAACKNLVWPKADLWVPTDTHTGLGKDYYALYFTSAHREANDVAAICTGVEIGTMFATDSLGDNGEFSKTGHYFNEHADGVVAYFGTAAAANRVYAECDTWG